MLIKIKEAIIVEGNYDKIKLDSIVDAFIITTDGFKIFSDKQKITFIRHIAEKSGIIVLTDSDRAGFLIRNYVKKGINPDFIKHAYIPDILGKEKRKATASKEGKLGVEGINAQIIIKALRDANATIIGEENGDRKSEKSDEQNIKITKLDLYNDGFFGKEDSATKRRMLLKELGLPERLSSNMLVDALNLFMDYDEYKAAAERLSFKN